MFSLRGGQAGDAYLKFGEGTVADAIGEEAARLRWLSGRVPVPQVVAYATEGERAWLLSAAVAGRSGDAWLDHDPALLPQIIDAFAGFLRRLHALDPDDCPFRADANVRLADARRRVAAGLVDEDDFDDDHDGWSAAKVLAEVERHARFADGGTVTHGDFSLGNLILDAEMNVTGCMDVGRVGIADAYQDVAILWQNLAEHGPVMQRRFLDGIGISTPDQGRLIFHRCLDELF